MMVSLGEIYLLLDKRDEDKTNYVESQARHPLSQMPSLHPPCPH